MKNGIFKIIDLFKLCALHLQLRFHGVRYGKNLRGRPCKIVNRGTIKLGDSVFLNSFPSGQMYKVGLFAYFSNSIILVGDQCKLNGTIIFCREKVIVGDYCMFGPGVVILDNDSHNPSPDPMIRRSGSIKARPVIIDDNVWVGMHSVVTKGVHIGQNSIVTPKSVVIKDVPPNTIAGGNPARFIKTLKQTSSSSLQR